MPPPRPSSSKTKNANKTDPLQFSTSSSESTIVPSPPSIVNLDTCDLTGFNDTPSFSTPCLPGASLEFIGQGLPDALDPMWSGGWVGDDKLLSQDPAMMYRWADGSSLARAKAERIYKPSNKQEWRAVYWLLIAADSNSPEGDDLARVALPEDTAAARMSALTPPTLALKKFRRRQCSFSCLKYGEEGAKQRAQLVIDFINMTGFLPPNLKGNTPSQSKRQNSGSNSNTVETQSEQPAPKRFSFQDSASLEVASPTCRSQFVSTEPVPPPYSSEDVAYPCGHFSLSSPPYDMESFNPSDDNADSFEEFQLASPVCEPVPTPKWEAWSPSRYDSSLQSQPELPQPQDSCLGIFNTMLATSAPPLGAYDETSDYTSCWVYPPV
eukprot:Blabericola_migrator_1__1716@NODE_1461_length_4509_cov_58_942593_g963_i0_p2_GENE_NODE_1461_length_4509_cov_58_942593_g963_i0NODE_1461_length_4509_cov_58_942593_g963_i0_p2_ORF_typecomplete_len381_score38_61_NODE_1461_length_4509_cov_58_942593_g963_i025123654